MTVWMLATIAVVPALALPLLAACRGDTAARFVAVQLASSVASLVLILLTFAFDQSSFVDLALALTMLTLPSTLLMALFLERWL